MKKLNKLIGMTLLLAIVAAGCKRDQATRPANAPEKPTFPTSGKMVLFPGAGWIPASDLHYIAPGHYLAHANGHYLEVEKGTDRVILDFGDFTRKPSGNFPAKGAIQQSFASSLSKAKNNVGAIPSGANWIDYATWANTQGSINYFSTNWKVPNAPTAPAASPTGPYQLYIWDALMDTQTWNNLMQPVLQYGTLSFSGGMYWSEVNVYVGAPTATTLIFVAYGPAIQVSAGSTIQGSINLLYVQDGSYVYSASGALVVNGVAESLDNTLTVQEGVTKWGPGPKQQGSKNFDSVATVIPQLNTAAEVLEAYAPVGVPTFITQYPSDNYDAMTAIQATTSTTGTPAINWNPVNNVTNFGQKTVVQPSGEVDLYFHSSAPPAITYPTPQVLSDGIPATISPTNTGGPIVSYSISPALPASLHLTFNTSTGVITGTPQSAVAGANYTITATNSNGSSQAVINISEVADVNFGITNNSANGLSITFYRTDQSQANISTVANAHSGANPPLPVPPGVYTIRWNPSGSPQNCIVTLSNGQSSPNTPGGQFVGVAVNNSGGVTSLSAR